MALPIRTVVGHFPSSSDLWDETSLPLAVALQPLASPHPASFAPTTTTTALPPPLSMIPKCLHCGAPQPTRQTHYHPSSSGRMNSAIETFSAPTFLLCYLCGKVSSATLEQQQAARWKQEEDVTDISFSAGRAAKSSNDTSIVALPLGYSSVLPKSSSNSSAPPSQQSHGRAAIYELPAMACPLLWFVVLDATATDSSYWRTVHELLMSSINNNIPSHVHLSIVLVSDQDCRIFQLDSPVPHLQQYPLQSPLLMERLFDSLVPMDEVHMAHTKTMLRSLLDYASYQDHGKMSDEVPVVTSYDMPSNGSHPNGRSKSTSSGMQLGWILSNISEALLQYGHNVGDSSKVPLSATTHQHPFPYAGAQVSVLLGGPPMHQCTRVDGTSMTNHSNYGDRLPVSPATRGVFGGRALSETISSCPTSSNSETDRDNILASDWSPEALEDRYPNGASVEWMSYYSDLGRQCVDAALAVDIMGIACEDEQDMREFGLVLMSGLIKTGGHGTAVYPIPSAWNEVQSEWKSREPWSNGRAFGVELRLRISPGFGVDANTSTVSADSDMPLFELYNEAGLTGPAFAEEESNLWKTASCDQYSTFSVDLQVTQSIVPNEFYVEHLGNVVTKPVVQTCCAYTTIETLEDGRAYTVRRMRISSQPVGLPHLASDTEAIYNSLDPEAMAIVLFHKLALASLQDGVQEAQPIAEEWLQALLVCAYRSAQQKDEELQEKQRNGLLPSMPDASEDNNLFVASERLLNRNGELSKTEILLGKGHAHLQNMSLMIFMLLQSDVFSDLSLDDRFAALSQLSSMPPDSLTRCIAPRLQLWGATSAQDIQSRRTDTSGAADELEPLVELIELRNDAIGWAVQDCATVPNDGLFFFVDSPRELLVVDASLVMSSGSGTIRVQLPKPSQGRSNVGPGLQSAIDFAQSSYPSRPPIRYVVEESCDEGLIRFRELCCNEDKALSPDYASFEAWRQAMAAQVESQLDLKESPFDEGSLGQV